MSGEEVAEAFAERVGDRGLNPSFKGAEQIARLRTERAGAGRPRL